MSPPTPRPRRPALPVALVLAALLTGCADDRGPAERAIATVETAYAKVQPRARALAPQRAAEIERQLDRARTAAREGDWITAFQATSALPGEIEGLSREIEQREGAARSEWDSTNVAIAARLEEVDATIARTASAGDRPAAIARANDELAAARVAWAQAIDAQEIGRYDEARIKVGEVQLRARLALSALASP